jgi:hypothetical protein
MAAPVVVAKVWFTQDRSEDPGNLQTFFKFCRQDLAFGCPAGRHQGMDKRDAIVDVLFTRTTNEKC